MDMLDDVKPLELEPPMCEGETKREKKDNNEINQCLKEILNTIISVYNENLPNDKKHQLLSSLWTRYYKLSEKLNKFIPLSCAFFTCGITYRKNFRL